jgi:hypothetical protein
MRSCFDPVFYKFSELSLRARCRGAAGPWVPSPADQMISGHVHHKLIERHPAVPFGVLYLRTDVGKRFSEPGHVNRRHLPSGISGRALKIGGSVTRGATHTDGAMIIGPPRNRRLMQTTIVPLMRAIASWMAIGAARMQNDLCGLFEERNGSRFLVIYVREVLGILQRLVSQGRVGDYGREKRSATGHHNREPKNPTHRHGPLRIAQARLCRRKIEYPKRPHDTISSDRFTNHDRIHRCGNVKIRDVTMHPKPAVIELDLGPASKCPLWINSKHRQMRATN